MKISSYVPDDDVGDVGDAGDDDSNITTTAHTLRNCEIVILKEMSSSSDSLFTDPISPSLLTTADQLLTEEDDDGDDEENLDIGVYALNGEETAAERYIEELNYKQPKRPNRSRRQQQQQRLTQQQQQRPLSDISATSGDTSGILSPTTAKAILELQQRHRADKLSQLSVSAVTFLHLPAIEIATTDSATEPSPDLELEGDFVDEQMALQLGKKLAQVLSGGGGSSGNSNDAGGAATPTPQTMSTNDIFNIAKAKKIELQNLSSRLVSAAVPLVAATAGFNEASSVVGEFEFLFY